MLKMQTSSFESERYANKERRLRVRFYKRASHQDILESSSKNLPNITNNLPKIYQK